MDLVKTYLLRLTAAALVCGIAAGMAKDKKLPGSLIKLLCAAVMVLTALAPLTNINGASFLDLPESIGESADSTVQAGKNAAASAWAEGIKQSAESYILDKADLYDATLSVEVTVTGDSPPVPSGIRISGRISPYGKKMLKEEITQKLGIAEEDQIWTE